MKGGERRKGVKGVEEGEMKAGGKEKGKGKEEERERWYHNFWYSDADVSQGYTYQKNGPSDT